MKANFRVTCALSWWVKPYLWALATACLIMGTQPDTEKLKRKILKGVRIRIARID
jgi:hypothetical protein